MSGYKSYSAIAEWGRNYGKEIAQALGFKEGKTPCVGTLNCNGSGLSLFSCQSLVFFISSRHSEN
ncbi:MAG: hypothetical protein WAQ98_06800 [Blastocatellia bacterium]